MKEQCPGSEEPIPEGNITHLGPNEIVAFCEECEHEVDIEKGDDEYPFHERYQEDK